MKEFLRYKILSSKTESERAYWVEKAKAFAEQRKDCPGPIQRPGEVRL